jgi:hypothetical protein
MSQIISLILGATFFVGAALMAQIPNHQTTAPIMHAVVSLSSVHDDRILPPCTPTPAPAASTPAIVTPGEAALFGGIAVAILTVAAVLLATHKKQDT